MCCGNDRGNFVMQKTLWCDSLYRQNISTLEIHCQLMLVFGDCVLRPHQLGRGCREFKSGLASIINITLFSGRSRTCEHSASGRISFEKTSRHNSLFIHCTGVICENVPNIVHVQLEYNSVCAFWVPRNLMEVHKKWCLQVLFLFFSHLKEEQTGSLDPW